jgi:hypothetical protein
MNKKLIKFFPYCLITFVILASLEVPLLPSFAENENKNESILKDENGRGQPPLTRTRPLTPSVPRRLSITVNIDSPDDLKVNEGDRLTEGQIIASRDRKKQELNRYKQQVELSLAKLKSFQPLPPTIPVEIPLLKALPPISYLEHEAAVDSAKTNIDFIEQEIQNKEEEIEFYHNLSHVDNNIIEHEKAKLEDIKQRHTKAIKDYQLALGKLETAKNHRTYTEYEASLNKIRRIEQLNQQQQNYERDLALYQQRKSEQEFRITQLNNNLSEVQEKLNSLSNTTSPYNGTVRRIKWLGQSSDGVLTAEVSLMIKK